MPTNAHATAILIAAYNAEKTLERAVRSALAQDVVAEVCVIDDCSSDRTAEIARALAAEDKRVHLIRLERNGGPAAARNAGLAASVSPWIGILDADDFLRPGRVETMLKHAEKADFIADVLYRVGEHEDPAKAVAAWDGASDAQSVSFEDFVEGNLGQANRPLDLGFIKPLMRRAFLDAHAISYRAEMRLGEDYEVYARALALGARLLLIPPAGYVSVERAGSLSKEHGETDLQRLRDCDDDIARIRTFTPSEQRALRRHRTSVDCRLQWRRLISAVKTKDARAALATFHTPRASVYLAARLGEQVWLRGPARFLGAR